MENQRRVVDVVQRVSADSGEALRRAHRPRVMPPSTGSITPVRKPAAGDSRKAAVWPNSSGSP